MRFQRTVLILVSVSLVASSASTAWSQASDPSDPFSSPAGLVDPFSSPAGLVDPFSSPAAQVDPFGGKADDDPFDGPPEMPKTANRQQKRQKPNAPKQPQTRQAADTTGLYVVTVGEREMDQRIHSTLQDETSHHFAETPLEEAVRMLSESHDIPMLIDQRALEEIGLTTDTPVNLALHRVSLRSFLRLMLRNLELTYMVKDEVLQITTREAAEHSLETRMYHLPELLSSKIDKVTASLQSSVEPDTWEVLGGPSTTSSINHVLVVSTTSDVHQEVYHFLDTLIRMHKIK